jgi:glycosyltransferase involved in cell wall biosynthesis
MHVAIVCRGMGKGGSVASVALRQARELSRHAAITLISDSFDSERPWAERAIVPVPDLRFLRRFRHVPDELLFARGARKALLAVHRERPLDFVLCHAHAPAYLAARPLRARDGVAFGLVVHGDITDRPQGTYDSRLTRFYRWVTPRAYASADVVIVLARTFVELARGGGARAVEVIPNGIDPAEIGLAGEPAVRGDGPLRVLYAGRLAVEKGLEHLLAACRLVRADYELTIIGSGPLEEHLRHAAAGLPHVHFIGPQPRTSLGAHYQRHHVFCTPALSEPFGLVILEALASGLPVIATRVGGIPELVQDGVNGLLVPPADPAALAAAIACLASDEPLRARLAAHARPSALPAFAWETIGEKLAAVIDAYRSR